MAEVNKPWKTWLEMGDHLSLIKFKPTRANSSQLRPSGWPNDTQLPRSWKLGSSWLELGVPFRQGVSPSGCSHWCWTLRYHDIRSRSRHRSTVPRNGTIYWQHGVTVRASLCTLMVCGKKGLISCKRMVGILRKSTLLLPWGARLSGRLTASQRWPSHLWRSSIPWFLRKTFRRFPSTTGEMVRIFDCVGIGAVTSDIPLHYWEDGRDLWIVWIPVVSFQIFSFFLRIHWCWCCCFCSLCNCRLFCPVFLARCVSLRSAPCDRSSQFFFSCLVHVVVMGNRHLCFQFSPSFANLADFAFNLPLLVSCPCVLFSYLFSIKPLCQSPIWQ